ncbi:MAG TPA: hypothetical protein GX743_06230, partial [Actinomycetales bacterium]|nr:hypothetical protein [Actinomycetales bacterium]
MVVPGPSRDVPDALGHGALIVPGAPRVLPDAPGHGALIVPGPSRDVPDTPGHGALIVPGRVDDAADAGIDEFLGADLGADFAIVGERQAEDVVAVDDEEDEPDLPLRDNLQAWELDDDFEEDEADGPLPEAPDLDDLVKGHLIDHQEVEDQLEEDEQDLPVGRFADRELSWLSFNQRVIEQAEDQDLPLLERAWFLAIFASNLDEFFMVRVAGLKRRIATGMAVTAASGLTPRQVMEGIALKAHELTERHARVLQEDVLPRLAEEGIHILHHGELAAAEQKRLEKFFRQQIFPVLTPLAVDPAHPFPYISGLSLNLAVVVRHPGSGKESFARVKVPPLFPRFIAVDAEGVPRRPEEIASDETQGASFV